jgi:alanyl-tRNA synthetase
MGDTGPCGPCSEILIDQGGAVGCGTAECRPGCDCDRYLEIWNLVFTQFFRETTGTLTPLPNPNIDTGMGLERIAAVIQGKTNNYDSDVFHDIIQSIEDISETKYGHDRKRDVAFRVIADHARAAAFLIGDGVMPANEGRGYVLRRIIRRAIRFGQVLGIEDPFLFQVAHRVIDIMGHDYRELLDSRAFISGVMTNEEKRFADTLHYGMKVLDEAIERIRAKGMHIMPGDLVFKLYDTYGLSPDILEDVAREEGFEVDVAGYEKAMEQQRSQSQKSWKGSGEAEIPSVYRRLTAEGKHPTFVGYDALQSPATVEAIVHDGKELSAAEAGETVEITLDKTPFYGEAGGQVGDTGEILGDGLRVEVSNALKLGGDLIVHQGIIKKGNLTVGAQVTAHVDKSKRRATALNHTATHLLHAALREILGDHVKQAGSFVSPERLRFDFSHFTQVGPERLKDVEDTVNRQIRENLPLSTEEMAREEALKTGAMAIFEERYGEKVRVVRIGEDVSTELCGGTHTARTGDIGVFKIISESAVGANLRRIEAITGEAALAYLQKQEREMKDLGALMKAAPDQLKDKIDRLLKDMKAKDREIEALKGKLLSKGSVDLLAGMKEIGGVSVLAKEVDARSPKELREIGDNLKNRMKSGILVLAAKNQNKAMLLCLVSKTLVNRYKAGTIVGELSKIVGGKGGGRPDMAQGGGNKPEEIGRALEAVYEMI